VALQVTRRQAIIVALVAGLAVGLVIVALVSTNLYDYRFTTSVEEMRTLSTAGWEPVPGAPSNGNGIVFYYRHPRLRIG
jgi:hypothetical protein